MTSFDVSMGPTRIRDNEQSYGDAAAKAQLINRAAVILKKDALGLPGHEALSEDDVTAAREFVALVASSILEQATDVETASPSLPAIEVGITSDRTLNGLGRLGQRLLSEETLDEQDLRELDRVVDLVGKSTARLFERSIHG